MEQRGSLDAVLYAALVSGFNSKSVSSVVVSNNIATITTTTNHGYKQYDIIQLSGSNDSIFNDSFTISSVPSLTTFTFPIITALTGTTGTITAKIAPLGWDRVFTGTNKSVYRSSNVQSTRGFLKVGDTTAQYATMTMYESMSDVDNGSGSFQVYWSKSGWANTAARPWYLIGDTKRFYLLVDVDDSGCCIYPFGDVARKYKSTDNYHCILGGQSSFATRTNGNTGMGGTGFSQAMGIMRGPTQLGGAVNFQLHSIAQYPGSSAAWGNNVSMSYVSTFPSPVDSSLHLYPVYVWDNSASAIRGLLGGFYSPGEATNGVHQNKERAVIFEGRTYLAFKSLTANGGTYWGNFFIDSTGPWE